MTTIETSNTESEVQSLNGEIRAAKRRLLAADAKPIDPVDVIATGRSAARQELDTILARAEVLREALGEGVVFEAVGKVRSTSGRAKRLPAIETAAKAKPTVPRKPKAKSAGRMARRSEEEIQAMVAKVAETIGDSDDGGMRAEDIRVALGLQAKEMPRVLKAGLASKQLRSKGQKRATRYFAKP